MKNIEHLQDKPDLPSFCQYNPIHEVLFEVLLPKLSLLFFAEHLILVECLHDEQHLWECKADLNTPHTLFLIIK